MNEDKSQSHNEPIITDDEMKLPDEEFRIKKDPAASSHLGFVLSALIIILVLLLGGLYLWSKNMEKSEPTPTESVRPTAEENNEPESNNAEAEVETLSAMSSSNSLEAIEADLENTELDNLDQELNTIEIEINNSN